MAGLCAAVAAARNGASVALVQDRPVLGGNASSEVRMWICGARGSENKETGLLEELLLENAARNPEGNYPTWDSVLWGFARFQPNLKLFLNSSCTGCETETPAGTTGEQRISKITCWQMSTQTWHHIGAKVFIDCSGDSILAPASGADFVMGRESRDDFGEDIAPEVGDERTMGNTVLIQLRATDEEQDFTPPSWAYRFDSAEQFPCRMRGVNGSNFWWIALGGINDTIRDAERISTELTRAAWGVWDYIKNRAPEREKARNWALEWIGSLPGKRESRRYRGQHVLTQHDIRDGGRFDDIVAYGGWPMDDHHPAGLLFPGDPTVFHDAPSPYGIPLRSLISRNVTNLMCAGRNISATHVALSSTRVMGTCALMGQAAGTAAAVAVAANTDPINLFPNHVGRVQTTLMEDDAWLPGLARQADALASAADPAGNGLLINGVDRPWRDRDNAWTGTPGTPVEFRWNDAKPIGGMRLVFDSNLGDHKRMPCRYPRTNRKGPPADLVKAFRIEVLDGGTWRTVFREDNNTQRLVHAPVNATGTGVRIVPEETWGAEEVRLFAAEPTTICNDKRPPKPRRIPWSEVVSAVPEEHLRAPDLSSAAVTSDPANDEVVPTVNVPTRRTPGPRA